MLLGLLAVADAFSAGLWGAYLQSLVPISDAVMCVVGVLRFGEGSGSVARFLPRIATILLYEKPALVFCGGVVLAVWQGCRHAPRLSRPLTLGRTSAVGLFSLVTLADAALESAYVLIPKIASSDAVGCCLLSNVEAGVGGRGGNLDWGVALVASFFGVNLLFMGLLLAPAPAWRRFLAIGRGASLLPAWALFSLPWAYLFLSNCLTGELLRTRFHRCVFDLATNTPEALVAFGLFFVGACAIFWGGVAAWVGSVAGSGETLVLELVEKYHFLAGISCLCSIAVWAVELVVS